MKSSKITIIVLSAFTVGAIGGAYLTMQRAKLDVRANLYSDFLLPAGLELATARSKLQAQDTNIEEHLKKVDQHMKSAEEWSLRFIGSKQTP